MAIRTEIISFKGFAYNHSFMTVIPINCSKLTPIGLLHAEKRVEAVLLYAFNSPPPPCVTCHMSHVMCQVSGVTFLYFYLYIFDLQKSSGASC